MADVCVFEPSSSSQLTKDWRLQFDILYSCCPIHVCGIQISSPVWKLKKYIAPLYTSQKGVNNCGAKYVPPSHLTYKSTVTHNIYVLKNEIYGLKCSSSRGAVLYSTTKMPNNAWNVLLNWHSLQHHHSVTRGETSLASNCSLSINLSQLCIHSFIWQISIFNCTLTPLWELY